MSDRIWAIRLDDDPRTHEYLEQYHQEHDIDKQEAAKRFLRKGIDAHRDSLLQPAQQALLTVGLLLILASGIAAVMSLAVGLTTQLLYISGGTAIGGLLAVVGYAVSQSMIDRARQRRALATDGGEEE